MPPDSLTLYRQYMSALAEWEIPMFLGGQAIPVYDSSTVTEIQYESDLSRLSVWFKSSPIGYRYPAVSPEMATDLARASSKGSWVYYHLRKPKWPFTRTR